MSKHSADRTAVFLPHCGHTKADGLRPEGREPAELSKAECSSPNRRTGAQIAILSKASFLGLVCLSAVYSTDTESDATQFLWIPSMSGIQALLSLLTAQTLGSTLHFPLGTWEDVRTPKKCALSCRDAGGITPVGPHGGLGSPEAAGVCT